MRKGLTKTLMAVAVAIMAMQAMAMAPVIGEIPSPVVGNAENVTPAQGFVYPDAIDLTRYVSDQESNSSQIIWSYEIIGTAKYRINNKDSMNTGGGDNPVSPGAKSLNLAVGGGEADFDSNPLTITVRNINLTPIIGTVGTSPGANDASGVINAETQAVTLYASDQTTYSSKSIWFYSNVGNDRLSPGLVPVYEYRADHATTTGWTWALINASVTQSNGTDGRSFCHTTVQSSTADNLAKWKSPYGTAAQATLPLVANSVYRIRLIINSSQTNVDNVPYWDVTVNNFDQVGSTFYGQNGYGANFFFLSNVGGANAAVQSGGDVPFEFWWTPSAVSSTRWNDTSDTQAGPFGPSNVDNRNAFIEFRILQAATNSGTNGNRAFGTMCLKDVTIEKADLTAMQVLTAASPVYSAASITNSASGGTSRINSGNFTSSFSGGTLTITPTAAGSGSTGSFTALVEPGDTNIDYTNQSATVDNYPCPMDLQTLYLISMDLSAPTQADMDNPPAIFWVGADSLTNELICLSWVTPVNFWHHAGPPLTPTSYKAFFHSNYGTVHSNDPQFSWWSIFRPRFMVGNDPSLGANETKAGAIRLHNMRVDKVQF
jgi:hypothetical protein